MKNILLWLDDIRDPNKGDWLIFSPLSQPYKVVWVKSYEEFINWISINGLPNGICFDHDLADIREQEKTGYNCAKWLIDYCMDNNKELPLWNCQSANPVGKENINKLLNNYLKYKKTNL